MKTTKYTNKELVEIYKNLKTSAKILGFASASDCEMMVAIELEAVKRHLNLIDGTVEETAERQKEVITMKTMVKNDRWNGIETVTVWFDDDMSTYEIIDNENGDTVTSIYDGKFLDTDGQVDYDRLYDAIADEIRKYLSCTAEIEEYDEDDGTPVKDRQYDVYYTDGENETYTTLDASTATEAFKAEQFEIDSWNEEAGYTKWWITKVRYTV